MENNMENNGVVTNDNGDVRLGTIWFNVEKGIVEGEFDIFKMINPSDKTLEYFVKGLDEFQKGLYYEVCMQEGLDIEKELEDLQQIANENDTDTDDEGE